MGACTSAELGSPGAGPISLAFLAYLLFLPMIPGRLFSSIAVWLGSPPPITTATPHVFSLSFFELLAVTSQLVRRELFPYAPNRYSKRIPKRQVPCNLHSHH